LLAVDMDIRLVQRKRVRILIEHVQGVGAVLRLRGVEVGVVVRRYEAMDVEAQRCRNTLLLLLHRLLELIHSIGQTLCACRAGAERSSRHDGPNKYTRASHASPPYPGHTPGAKVWLPQQQPR